MPLYKLAGALNMSGSFLATRTAAAGQLALPLVALSIALLRKRSLIRYIAILGLSCSQVFNVHN
jgi:hypothetical protein